MVQILVAVSTVALKDTPVLQILIHLAFIYITNC